MGNSSIWAVLTALMVLPYIAVLGAFHALTGAEGAVAATIGYVVGILATMSVILLAVEVM